LDDEQKEKKLKDLEKSLAEELDQKVAGGTAEKVTATVPVKDLGDAKIAGDSAEDSVVSSVSDASDDEIPLDGISKDSDDSLKERFGSESTNEASSEDSKISKNSETSQPPIGGDGSNLANDLSIDEIDAILKNEDPNFSESLSILKEDLNEVEGEIELAPLEIEGMDEEASKTDTLPQAPKKDYKYFVRQILFWPINKIKNYIYTLRDLQEKGLSLVVEKAKSSFHWSLDFFKNSYQNSKQFFVILIKWFTNLQKLRKLQLISFVFIMFLIGLLVQSILSGRLSKELNHDPFLSSFLKVAEEVIKVDPKSALESFDSPLRHPEYVVLLKKVVANLKPSLSSGAKPMAAFELYIEASSREAAVEINGRYKEFKDRASRVMETMPYDQVIKIEGKVKLKTLLRRELNEILLTGHIKKVYFKTLFYKP